MVPHNWMRAGQFEKERGQLVDPDRLTIASIAESDRNLPESEQLVGVPALGSHALAGSEVLPSTRITVTEQRFLGRLIRDTIRAGGQHVSEKVANIAGEVVHAMNTHRLR
ncbi:MAG TPA: hypothetical protein VG604_00535 [Candidatus Saccharimonadales bacterium]|nr:hypothetical protein [Candidatus Saccharimonadales bacterium]